MNLTEIFEKFEDATSTTLLYANNQLKNVYLQKSCQLAVPVIHVSTFPAFLGYKNEMKNLILRYVYSTHTLYHTISCGV